MPSPNLTVTTSETGGSYVPTSPITVPILYTPVLPVSPIGPNQVVASGPLPDWAGQGVGDITFILNQLLDISDASVNYLANTVKSGVTAGINQAADIANSTSQTVIQNVGRLTNGLLDGVNNTLSTMGGWLKDIGSAIYDNLGALIGFLKDHIGSIITTVADAVKSALGPILEVVHSVAVEIQSINDNFIQPLSNIILGTIQTLSTLTETLERDFHEGFKGILQIPTDLANSLTSLDATFQRSIQQMGTANKAVIETTIGGTAEDTIHTRLKSIGDVIDALKIKPVKGTTLTDAVRLSDPGINEAIGKTFDAIWKEILTFLTTSLSSFKGFSGAMSAIPLAIPFIAEAEWEIPAALIGFTLACIEAYEPALTYIREDIENKARLAKLSPNDVLLAWQRGFVNDASLDEELGVRGWDSGRQKVLKDLQTYLIDVQSILDMWFRGIVSDEDLAKNFKAHGITPDQTEALKEDGYKIPDVGTARVAYNRGIINDVVLDEILQENRYTPEEQFTFKQTALSVESVSGLIERHKRNTLYSNHLTSDPLFNTVPDDIIQLARANGDNPQVAADQWMTQFSVPGVQHWIALMFRGKRTHTEVMAAMDYFRVPQEWRDDYIVSSRALIPFRTIPSMVKAKIITESYAKEQLAAHGYDATAVNALLSYAQQQKTSTSATKAIQNHEESVGVAQQLYNLGAINDAQYSEVLKAHQYTDSAIAAELQLTHLKQQLNHRKETGAEIVARAVSGEITYESAQEQMHTAGFTAIEIARYAKQIRNATKQTTKIPAEAQLVAMVKNSIITQDEFTTLLEQSGYSKDWAEKITVLHFAHAS